MKNVFYILVMPVLVSLVALNGKTSIQKKTIDPEGFAVVELFTSEGCSSCPAAEAVLARIADNYHQQVFVLGFHVDYWNRLGWKDTFSSAAYSERQRQYSGATAGDGVYTPQVIINGSQHFVGSDEIKMRKAIDESLSRNSVDQIQLSVKENTTHSVNVIYTFAKSKDDLLNIALIQLHAQTKVRAGENSGHTLQHINVVRDFKTLADRQGTIELDLPGSLGTKDCAIIAFTQNRKTLAITGATHYSFNN